MDKMKDSSVIYFNHRKKVFLVVSEARRGRYGRSEVGRPAEIADAEFEAKVGDVLLRSLDSFQTNVFSPETARRASGEEHRVFSKQHVGVDVERALSGDLILRPLHHLQGGYVANRGEQIVVSKEDVPQKIATALREAFKLAT